MSLPPYEYSGLMAEAWDVLRGDTSRWADRAFFLELIERSGQPVLDVGCGTGRLLLDVLGQGIDVHGVDNSPEMLAICRAKARRLGLTPSVHEQHMEALSLPRRYRTILIPSSTLQLVVDAAAAREALRRLATESEHVAVRADDGATFRRVARAAIGCARPCRRGSRGSRRPADRQKIRIGRAGEHRAVMRGRSRGRAVACRRQRAPCARRPRRG